MPNGNRQLWLLDQLHRMNESVSGNWKNVLDDTVNEIKLLQSIVLFCHSCLDLVPESLDDEEADCLRRTMEAMDNWPGEEDLPNS